MQFKDFLKRPIWLSCGSVWLASSFLAPVVAQAVPEEVPETDGSTRSRFEDRLEPGTTGSPIFDGPSPEPDVEPVETGPELEGPALAPEAIPENPGSLESPGSSEAPGSPDLLPDGPNPATPESSSDVSPQAPSRTEDGAAEPDNMPAAPLSEPVTDAPTETETEASEADSTIPLEAAPGEAQPPASTDEIPGTPAPSDLPEEPPEAERLDNPRDSFPTVPLDETLTEPFLPSLSPPEALPPELSDPSADPPVDSSMPAEDSPEAEGDPDLGVLLLRERELSLQSPPIRVPVYFQLNSSYLSNSNTRASEDPVEDQLFRATASLTATPILNRKTALYGTVQGNLFRYGDLSELDYNEIRFRAGIRRVLFSRTIGELNWTHRQLFFREDGDRFLSDHAVMGVISRRDPLSPKSSLSSFYRVRANFADPKTSSRVVNSVGTTISYDLTPQLKASVTGIGVLTSFTHQSRQDAYAQALASLTYNIGGGASLSLFSAINRGGSSDSRVDFDNALIGVSFNTNFKLFELRL